MGDLFGYFRGLTIKRAAVADKSPVRLPPFGSKLRAHNAVRTICGRFTELLKMTSIGIKLGINCS